VFEIAIHVFTAIWFGLIRR